jgi:hypothetical protein
MMIIRNTVNHPKQTLDWFYLFFVRKRNDSSIRL